MSKRTYISRYTLILQKLRTKPYSTFKELQEPEELSSNSSSRLKRPNPLFEKIIKLPLWGITNKNF